MEEVGGTPEGTRVCVALFYYTDIGESLRSVRMDSRGYIGTYIKGNMTTVQTYTIKFESLSISQYKLSNIWIDPEVIYGLTKYYYKKSNFIYNSNSILEGLLRKLFTNEALF